MQNGARVLLVEDDALHLKALGHALQGKGFDVTTASCVSEALTALNEDNGFHAAVVDYKLGDRTGSEVVAALSSGGHFTASLMLTGEQSPEVVKDAYSRGVLNVLTKPVALEALVPAVLGCVARTQEVREQIASADTTVTCSSQSVVIYANGEHADVEPSVGAASLDERAHYLTRRGHLSKREHEVLFEVLKGQTNAEIGRTLTIAERTVKFHISNINNKFGVLHRGQLMALLAIDPTPPTRNGAVSPADTEDDRGPAPEA